ncbi:HNH endonuclease [Nocardia brasiliensis]|uniref:HNH endonuclease n=1 Tax=Nocardia brasiliensis TaxID=37326 RepID=UPI00366B93D2
MDSGAERALRLMICEHLSEVLEEQGALTRTELTNFSVKGEVYKLIDRNKGIWNPKQLLATLSIMSTPNSGYPDEEVGESLFAYAYREGNINGDNTKLRRAYQLDLPIILLRWIRDGVYIPVCPVYVVADDMPNRRFILALDESLRTVANPLDLKPIERVYAQRVTRQRLHQPEFRARVLLAYESRCAVCGVGHTQLLEAAHIIADGKEHGAADISNGLCLCKIHHAAYDANLLGITPGYEVRIGAKLMQDLRGGSMLKHGLQAMNGNPLALPRSKKNHPSTERLAERFTEFQAAS